MIIGSNRKGIARGAILLVTLLLLGASNVGATASPVPFVESVGPLSVAPGGAAFTLTVTGTGFVSDSVVNFGGTALVTTYVSDTTVTAAVTATLIATGGTGWITVTNPGTPNRVSNLAFLNVGSGTGTVNYASNTYAAGSTTLGIAQGDFNGDGILDVVIANYGSDSLSVFLGNGDGTFQTATTISLSAVSTKPISVAVGDFNNDGKADLAVGYQGAAGISILLGNGDGTFQTPQTFTGGDDTYGIVVGDFNGDGKLDVAATNYGNSSGVLYVWLGNGDGTLGTGTSYSVGSTDGVALHEADVNNDGNLDLVAVGHFSGTISVLLGNGDGTFQTPTTIASTGAEDVAIGDFNGDGKLDLVATNSAGNDMSIMLGNGDGTFQAATSIAAGGATQVITSADFNADGKLDLAVVGSGATLILLGNGDGTFQAPQSFSGTTESFSILAGNYVTGGGLGIAEGNGTALQVLLQTVTLSPSTFAFGNQALSLASSAQSFTLTNNTSQTVTISGISFTGANASDFADTTTCGATLASGASCTISVTFTPAALGAAAGTLSVADNAPGATQTATLTGSGIDAPVVTLSSPSLAFQSGGVGVASAPQAVTVTNIGSATLNISGIAVAGANGGDFGETTTCGATLATSATCTVTVTFTPTASGARVAAVTLTDDAANSPQSIALTGSVAVATANLSAPSITFNGQVVGTTSAAQSVTLTNSGGAALTVASIAVSGANAGDFVVTNNCGASLAGAANCAIGATFKPTAGGTRTATITITDSATSGTQTITLQGTGEDFSMAFTGGSTVASGLSENLTLTVTPQGGFTGTVALTCSGAPELSTCTVSPTSVTLNGTTAVTSTFTLSTGTTAANIPSNVPPAKFPPAVIRWGSLFAALLMLAMMTLGLKAPKGRTLRPAALSFGVLLLLVSVAMSACIGVTKHETIPTTPPGTYTLTATGTSGSLTNTATVGITVSK